MPQRLTTCRIRVCGRNGFAWRDNSGVFVARVVDQPTRIRGVDVELIQEGLTALTVIAEDADGPELLLYSFDFDGDGAYEVENAVGARAIHRYQSPGDKRYVVRTLDTWSGTTTEQEGRFELPNWVPGNQPPTIDALSIDVGHGGVAELNVQASDADQDRLTYEVRWGDVEEGEFVEIANGNATHAYAYRESRRPYIGVARVSDGRGGVVDVPFDVAVQDEPTRIADVTVTPVGDGEYEVRVTADDLDSDALLFSYDFEGDGIYEIEASPTHVARHQYEAPANYRVSVRVTDPWSGQSVTTVTELAVDPWIVENRAPLIDGLAIETGHRGRVQLTIDAFDEDGHALSTFVRWGDEEDGGADTAFVGRNVVHDYAYRPAQRPYFGYVRVVDSEGAESRREFAVEVADTETELRDLTSERVREGTWLLSIEAMDPDAQDELEYSFDFDADGQWDLENTLNHQVVHTFGAVGRYPVGVRVRDPWSGRAVDAVYVVGDDRDGTPNLPPVIDSVAIDVAPGGEAKLRLDATDPEGGELEVTVFWGDSQFDVQERVVGFEASHVYPYPVDGRSYDGRLVVTDASGLETLYPFTVEITDRPTDVEQITMSVLRNGTVFVAVSATDPDSDGLEYAFDMNGDGLFEAAELQLGEFVYEYEGGGTYEVVVAVTDPWSGVTVEVEKVFVLEPWIRAAPFADDHLEGEEGRCLVLRVAQGRVTSESGPSVCEREQNPNAEDWRWDFGDGTVARGSEVGHVYARDGIYSVTVTGGTQSQPIESVIEVLIVNVAPDFITEPPEDAEGGETYFYTVELQDQGPEDEIQLELTQGPAGMNLTPSVDENGN